MSDFIYNRTYTTQTDEENKVYTMLEEIAKLANQVDAAGIANINTQFDNINVQLQNLMTTIVSLNHILSMQQTSINSLSNKVISLENSVHQIKLQNEQILNDIGGVDNALIDILGE